jgi:hypothetical protein
MSAISISNTLLRRALVVLACLPGCGDDFFGLTGSGDDEVGESSESGEPQPSEGIRVYPRYLTVEVAAVVSIEAVESPMPSTCELDGQGGYLCDTQALGPDVIVRVERDGFEPQVRALDHPYGYVDTIAVHLVPVGGPLGVWSACVTPDQFANCDEVCAAEGKTCLPTSCASGDPSEPIATELGYEGSECVDPPSRVEAQACSASHPAAFTDSVRCCCAP